MSNDVHWQNSGKGIVVLLYLVCHPITMQFYSKIHAYLLSLRNDRANQYNKIWENADTN